PRELPLLGAAAEAGEGAEGDVLLVGGPPRRVEQPLAGQADQATEVALPEPRDGGRVAGLELAEQVRDGAVLGRHWPGGSMRPEARGSKRDGTTPGHGEGELPPGTKQGGAGPWGRCPKPRGRGQAS